MKPSGQATLHRLFGIPLLAVLAIALLASTGCWDDDRIDHKSPSGQGGIVVDNRVSEEMKVFVDGIEQDRVRARRWKAYDREPGVYRLVLDARRNNWSWSGDVDVLANRLTVVEITGDAGRSDRYSVFIYYD